MGYQDDGHQKKQGRSEHDKQQGKPEQGFIPGLPDDIVLEQIATRIPWISVFALTRVNQAWRRAIRSREIYNVRKRCGASQSMVVAPVEDASEMRKGFYDVESQGLWLFHEDHFKHFGGRLFPVLQQGETFRDALYDASLTFLDGKLYAIWERKAGTNYEQEVQVLDIGACQRAWKVCSSIMNDGQVEIWAACNGKFYSFVTSLRRFHGKVFDPKSYKWTEIEDRPLNVCYLPSTPRGRVAVLNERIYVANTWDEDMMVFDSVTEKWHVIPNTLSSCTQINTRNLSVLPMSLIVIEGKMYNFSGSQVEQYNPESNSWIALQRTFHKDFMDYENASWNVVAMAPYGSEVIAMLDMKYSSEFRRGVTRKLCKSMDLGVKGKPLIWEGFSEIPLKSFFHRNKTFKFGNLEL